MRFRLPIINQNLLVCNQATHTSRLKQLDSQQSYSNRALAPANLHNSLELYFYVQELL